ncbi:MAG: aspartyl/glutamyl-tRNA(Asn/Gln) amidotransferase subunit C [bacterium]|nr:MAG: aspartyl/glutamyl-tRNA(Asn/Gln) amidotransferase subunit C [bacterium]
MKVSLKEVEDIAFLARIALSEAEKKEFAKDLNNILNYVDKMNELDTSKVEPTAHILDIHNVDRKDEVKKSMPVEEIIDLAPKSNDNFIVVPKVL